MFRIRRIYDDSLPLDRNAIEKVQKILRDQFPGLSEKSIGKLPEQLRNPVKYRFRSILFVAESHSGNVKGFAILQHDPELRFCYLDFMSTAKYRMNAGTGSALYARVRDAARGLKVLGIFFECLPDDPKLCKDPLLLNQNRSRLRFYELHGARPIINTAYATPFKAEAGVDCPPYLMYDNLGSTGSLARDSTRPIVRAILERNALVRPPGHHAERRAFGGFCYFNSTAIAAHRLSSLGRVAVLDLDYHHGNGTQSIFYHRSDVVTVSIHGHPRIAYPYFSGFEDEKGEGEGMGFNVNVPLPEQVTAQRYKEALARQVERIIRLKVKFLVVCLGLDTAKGDPTGSWSLMPRDFRECGRLVGSIHLPTLIVQEDGYRIRTLGSNARNFFLGLIEAPGTI